MSGFTPSIWFTLTPDGKVTMHIVKAEMGQHVGTGLAQVIAEELEVKWDDVRLDSPLESVENFAIYGLAYTVNSGSITTEFDRLSRAGAAGRMALIEAGAKVLGANEADCTASKLARDRPRLGPLHQLWRDHSEGEDRPQVRVPRRLQGDQAQRRRAPTTSSANRSRRSTSRPRPTARRSTASTYSCRTWCMARSSYRARATALR